MCILLDCLQGVLCDVVDASKSSLLLVLMSHLAADPRVFSGRKELFRGYERLWLGDVVANKVIARGPFSCFIFYLIAQFKLTPSFLERHLRNIIIWKSSPELHLTPGTVRAIKAFSIWYSRVPPTGALSVVDLTALVEACLQISTQTQSATATQAEVSIGQSFTLTASTTIDTSDN